MKFKNRKRYLLRNIYIIDNRHNSLGNLLGENSLFACNLVNIITLILDLAIPILKFIFDKKESKENFNN